MLEFIKIFLIKWFPFLKQNPILPLVKPETRSALLSLQYYVPEPRFSQIRTLIIEDSHSIEGIKADPELAYLYAYNIIQNRWIDAEPTILLEPKWIFQYAKNVIQGRWIEGEIPIQNDIVAAVDYAIYVLNDRWIEIEEKLAVAKNAFNVPEQAIINYARFAIKGQFPEAMQTLLEDPVVALQYCAEVMQERWVDLESIILEKRLPYLAADYASLIIKDRWFEAEDIIMQDASAVLNYANIVLKTRWSEAAEEIVKQDPHVASRYADLVIKGRWIEAEPFILIDPYAAAYYAVEVIKGRWIEAEQVLATEGSTAIDYAINVLKGRFSLGEHAIELDDELYTEYQEFLEEIATT